MITFKQFVTENDERNRYATYNPKKDYKNAKFLPFTTGEIKKAIAKLEKLPRAAPDRRWFDTDNEIDCRDLGFIWSKQTKIPNLTWGMGRAFGIARIPINKIVAMQSSIRAEGIESYLNNKKLGLPVVVQYPGVDQFSVAHGHTRIAAQHLAGRTPEVLLIWSPDEYNGKGRRPTLNWIS